MSQDEKLGALWQKSSGRGDYFTGQITIDGVTTKIVVFANKYRTEDKHPDWLILKSKPRADGDAA